MKGRLILLGVGAAVAAVVLVLLGALGVPTLFAASWLLIVLTIALVSRQVFFDEASLWPPEQRRRAERGSEVSRLAWSINSRTGVAGHVVVRRVQNVLRRRLAHRGSTSTTPLNRRRSTRSSGREYVTLCTIARFRLPISKGCSTRSRA